MSNDRNPDESGIFEIPSTVRKLFDNRSPIRYSNQDFDECQRVAIILTDDDRKNGRPAPGAGYSNENFEKAKKLFDRMKRNGYVD